MWTAADKKHFESLEDYEYLKPFLDLDNDVDEEVPELDLPKFQPDFSSILVVDGLPVIPADKKTRLFDVILKIYNQVSPVTPDDIYMPFNESTQQSYGFAFIKFSSKENAETSMKVSNGIAIDRRHSFKVSIYTDLDKYSQLADEYVTPPVPPFHARPDPTSWLTDPQCRDQFVTRHATETEIYWANPAGEEPFLVYGGEREKGEGKVWCENYVSWSPQGTYLATYHVPGIKLWGNEKFESQGRFMHQKVEDLSFSPCETYLITYRYLVHPNLDPDDAIIVWDIRSGAKLRNFPLKNPLEIKFQVQATIILEDSKQKKQVEKVIRGRVKAYAYDGDSSSGYFTIEEGSIIHDRVEPSKVVPLQDPNRLKWSPDGKYVARLGPDMISVYEMPAVSLLEKKSIAAKEILDFMWSPKSNMISYWCPAEANHPALINIIRVPERDEISSRKLFDVSEGRMVWQNEGDYLCVHMVKLQAKKKSFVLMFFRVRDHGIPVEQIELFEPVLHVSWEPSGDRIVIVHGEVRTPPSVTFYSMSGTPSKAVVAGKGSASARHELTLLFTRTGSQYNDVLWSPAGGIAALAMFAPDTCMFDLLDVDTNVIMASRRHDRCNRLFWDPSGRYLATCTVTDIRNANVKGMPDDGFNIYTFQGGIVAQVKQEKLYQFSWRPRPKDLLSAEDKKKVIKKLPHYIKIFNKEDEERKTELIQEVEANRLRLAQDFYGFLNRIKGLTSKMIAPSADLTSSSSLSTADSFRPPPRPAPASADLPRSLAIQGPGEGPGPHGEKEQRVFTKGIIPASRKSRRVALRDGYDSDDDKNYKIEIIVEKTVISSKDQIIQ